MIVLMPAKFKKILSEAPHASARGIWRRSVIVQRYGSRYRDKSARFYPIYGFVGTQYAVIYINRIQYLLIHLNFI